MMLACVNINNIYDYNIQKTNLHCPSFPSKHQTQNRTNPTQTHVVFTLKFKVTTPRMQFKREKNSLQNQFFNTMILMMSYCMCFKMSKEHFSFAQKSQRKPKKNSKSPISVLLLYSYTPLQSSSWP